MTKDEIAARARELAAIYGSPVGALGLQDVIVCLVDDATKGLRDELAKASEGNLTRQRDLSEARARISHLASELDHWKTCTGHATPEDLYLAHLDASENERARIAELEAALELHAPNDPLVIEAAERATEENGRDA